MQGPVFYQGVVCQQPSIQVKIPSLFTEHALNSTNSLALNGGGIYSNVIFIRLTVMIQRKPTRIELKPQDKDEV
jgi:hypothetical protein